MKRTTKLVGRAERVTREEVGMHEEVGTCRIVLTRQIVDNYFRTFAAVGGVWDPWKGIVSMLHAQPVSRATKWAASRATGIVVNPDRGRSYVTSFAAVESSEKRDSRDESRRLRS